MKKMACILSLLLVLCMAGCSNNDSSSSIFDKNKVYKYGLTFYEYKEYLYWFGFIINESRAIMKDEKDDIYLIKNNERTEFIVKRFNYIFFSDNASSDVDQYLSILREYGITKETPLTVEWVCNNPYNAYNIIKSLDIPLKEEIRFYPPDSGYPKPVDPDSITSEK